MLIQSATRGRRAGWYVVLGLCTGLLVHTLAVALGLAAVFAASTIAFTVLKITGSLYLSYLAWQLWRAPVDDKLTPMASTLSPLSMYLRGVFMNLTNPKVVFFFLAFLPQFVQTERGSVALQLACLGGMFVLATLVSFGAINYFASLISAGFRRSVRARRLLNRVAAVVFVGMAARLAFSQQQ